MKILVCLTLIAAVLAAATFAAPAENAAPVFAAEHGAGRLAITRGGQPVADYFFKHPKVPRPFFSTLRAPDGTQLTRNFPPQPGDAQDHDTLHPGLWMAFGDLNGVDFWRNKGRIEHVRFIEEPRVADGVLTFAVEEKYLAPDGKEVCRGVNHFRFSASDAGTVLAWEATLRRADGPLTIGPQHEMGMGFRMATPLCVKGGSGSIASSHGGKNETGNWGRAAQWWDYAGEVAGRHAGILVVPALENTRPMWSHARDYGFLAINPTGPPPGAKDVPSVPFTVAAGDDFSIKATFVLHSSSVAEKWDAAAVAKTVSGTIRVAPPIPRAVPTFECMSLYWDVPEGAPQKPCAVQYRVVGASQWCAAQSLWFDAKKQQYRGSVVQLAADTEYEFSLRIEGGGMATVTARTWSNRFPIANTTVLPKGTGKSPLAIKEGGTASGYRLYTAAPEGTTIDVADAADACVSIEADFVILRGVKCVGARIDGVRIGNQRSVVIEGCDISGWGRRDPQAGKTLRLSGKDCAILPNLALYLDAGIRIDGPDSTQIVVQGCRIHHPRYTANNWTQASPYFSKNGTLSTHPQGADAIVFAERTGGRHVIRWNELDGGDYDHMFNDALLAAEPKGNGFIGDGDIYGNRIAHCWDDGIEAERGERNVRIWGNHFSDVIKCVSAGYVWEGPLYVFRNVAERLIHPQEMPAHNGGLSPFLDHPPCFMPPPQEDATEKRDGVVYVYHNTLMADSERAAGWVFNTWWKHRYVSPTVRLISRNNLWMTRAFPGYFALPNLEGRNYMVREFDRSYFDQDYDLHNGEIVPASSAGPHTLQKEPVFAEGHGPGHPGRWQLAADAPGYDDGMVLPNINDHSPGKGPDRGAHEAGSGDMQFGPALWVAR